MVNNKEPQKSILDIFKQIPLREKLFKATIGLKITLPYVLLALIFSLVATFIVTQLVFENLESRFQSQLISAG